MNNPNPFVPKGSLLEQQSQRRSRLKIAVFCILAVSVTGLVAMLIQGCKRENPDNGGGAPQIDTNQPALAMTNPPAFTDTNPPQAPMPPSNATAMTQPPSPISTVPPVPPTAPPEQTAAAGTYEVVAGDTLGKIAKAHGVSLKALEGANPGVDPKKLHAKQKLNIPAATQSTEATAAPQAGTAGPGSGTEYVVKSGDTLTKIAKKNGVKVKDLRAANPKIASTDHIHVGDKLTIPAKTEAAAPATTTDTSAPAAAPTMPPQTTSVPPATPGPGH
jgi:LysM repeat protein